MDWHLHSDDSDMEDEWLGLANGYHFDGPEPLNLEELHDMFDDNLSFNSYDDYDEYELSDSDYFNDHDDDEEDEGQRLFDNLQDSFSVLPQIEYQGKTNGNLPRPEPNVPETYESLYKLLCEAELLLKTWKKRLSHPYTAHLEHNDPGFECYPPETEEDSDMSDGDPVVHYDRKKCNETQTKAKYCYSTRLYKTIFCEDKSFNETLSQIRQYRKSIFDVAFSLFLDVLPSEVKDRLPNEIWEKIWCFTQTPYKEKFSSGYRANDKRYGAIERDRVTGMFCSLGNLHMLVLEILYKSPYILKNDVFSEIVSVETTVDVKRAFAKSTFQRCWAQLQSSWQRLQALEGLPGIPSSLDPANGAEEPVTEELNLVERLEAGAWSSETVEIKFGKERRDRNGKVDVLIVPEHASKFILIPNCIDDNKGEIIVYDVSRQQRVYCIQATLNSLLHLFFMSGSNQNSRLDVSDKSLVYICYDDALKKSSKKVESYEEEVSEDEEDETRNKSIVVYRWIFPDIESEGAASQDPFQMTEDDAKIYRINWHPEHLSTSNQLQISLLQQGNDDQEIFLLFAHMHQNVCQMATFDPNTSEIVNTQVLEPNTKLAGVSRTACLLINNSSIELMCLETFKSIKKINLKEICESRQSCAEHLKDSTKNKCWYSGKLDTSSDENQFVIYSKHLVFYQVYKFTRTEATLINSGSSYEIDLLDTELDSARLNKGLLFCSPMTMLEAMLTASPGYFSTWPMEAQIMAFDLTKPHSRVYPITTLVKGLKQHHAVLVPLFNRHGHSIYESESISINFIQQNCLVITMGTSLLLISFHASVRSLAEDESAKFEAKILELEAEKLKLDQQWQNKAKNEMTKLSTLKGIMDQVKDQKFQGRIKTWKSSYGFIKPGDKTKKLGTPFVHISAIENRSDHLVREGTKVEFTVELDHDRLTFRANWAKVVAKSGFEASRKTK